MDELFEALTLVQTDKVRPIPIILDFLVEEGFIEPAERELATLVDTGVEAADRILRFYGRI